MPRETEQVIEGSDNQAILEGNWKERSVFRKRTKSEG